MQAVDFLEAEQAVVSPYELVAEAAVQASGDAREVGDRLQVLAVGQLARDGDLPGVLEAERGEPPEVPALEELGADAVQRPVRSPLRLLAEDRDQSRSRVLGVDVDRSGFQRLEADLRAREAEPALHLEVGAALQELGEHLGEHPALLEVLGADDDAVGGMEGESEREAGGAPN